MSLTWLFNSRIAHCLTDTKTAQQDAEFYLILWAFPDGWCLLKGMWSESEAVRVTSSPPPHNKTEERHTTMEWSWWRTFASHWPPASQTGPLSQAWSVAPSNPTQHLCFLEMWIETFCPSIEAQGLAPNALSGVNQPLSSSQLRPKSTDQTRTLKNPPIYLLWDDISVSTSFNKCDVKVHSKELKYAGMTACNYTENKDRRHVWCDAETFKIMALSSTIT